MEERKSGLAHCCHHDIHWEYCYNFDERVLYIQTEKPKAERKMRLRLFQLVPEELLPGRDSDEWDAFNKAKDDLNKARDTYIEANDAFSEEKDAFNKVKDAYIEARDAFSEVKDTLDKAKDAYIAKYQTEIDAIHEKLFPDCTWDGKTIFRTRRKKMIKLLFYRCLLGWHILLEHKTSKRKQEYQLRMWKSIRRRNE